MLESAESCYWSFDNFHTRVTQVTSIARSRFYGLTASGVNRHGCRKPRTRGANGGDSTLKSIVSATNPQEKREVRARHVPESPHRARQCLFCLQWMGSERKRVDLAI